MNMDEGHLKMERSINGLVDSMRYKDCVEQAPAAEEHARSMETLTSSLQRYSALQRHKLRY